jgi:hypothetical protein
VTLLTIQGCAPATPADADAITHPRHSVTLSTAQAVYRSYLGASDAAAAAGHAGQGLAAVSAAQWAQVKGQYTTLATAGTPVPRYRYSQPAFYVPALAGTPRWFVVAASRSTFTHGQLSAPVPTLLLFTQVNNIVPWTLSGSAVLDQPLPAIARDSDGYAVDVTTTDPSLLLRPDVVGATHAAVVDQGPASPAAAVVAAGPRTTGFFAAQSAQAAAEQAKGLRYSWLLQGSAFRQFELRLADGGALVLYTMYLNTTDEHPNLVAGAPIPVPAAFSPLLAVPTETGYHAVYANWTYEFAAIDPPAAASHAKLRVIGAQGAPAYGHAY